MKNEGFTLIELLIVIAIIGIILAIGLANYGRWRAGVAVMDGAQQFAQAISSTRTGAKRANVCWQIALPDAKKTDSETYLVTQYPGTTCTGTGTTRTYNMPPGTTLTLTSATNGINFKPPYGTADSSPDTFEVKWASNPSIMRKVRVTSIFGKVVIK